MSAATKVALVTGGSRGIGAATAVALARAGMDVAVNYLTHQEEAERICRSIEAFGRQAVALRADVSEPVEAEAMIQAAVETLGSLHVLVNNAGYSAHATVDELTGEAWRRMMAVGLDGPFYCAKAAVVPMRAAGWGRIVNLASLRAMTGSDHGAHYAAAKAGVIGLTKSLALELAPNGITVNAISPGYTETDMNRQSIERHRELLEAKIPIGRVAHPEEIAALIVFLCSDEAGYITGETININGGLTMR